jgi:hypothetical protein
MKPVGHKDPGDGSKKPCGGKDPHDGGRGKKPGSPRKYPDAGGE